MNSDLHKAPIRPAMVHNWWDHNSEECKALKVKTAKIFCGGQIVKKLLYINFQKFVKDIPEIICMQRNLSVGSSDRLLMSQSSHKGGATSISCIINCSPIFVIINDSLSKGKQQPQNCGMYHKTWYYYNIQMLQVLAQCQLKVTLSCKCAHTRRKISNLWHKVNSRQLLNISHSSRVHRCTAVLCVKVQRCPWLVQAPAGAYYRRSGCIFGA